MATSAASSRTSADSAVVLEGGGACASSSSLSIGEEIVAVPHGLDENERTVEHQRNDAGEDKLRRAEDRTGRGRREVRQNQRQRGERGQHGERGARALELKSLLVMARAAPEQAEPDDTVANDHDGGEDRVACQSGLFRRTPQP